MLFDTLSLEIKMNSSVNVHMQKEKEPDALSGPSHLDSATGEIMCFIEASATFFSQGSSHKNECDKTHHDLTFK
jgi:hypothetical protein